jgi:uncharacterized oxidoreductase
MIDSKILEEFSAQILEAGGFQKSEAVTTAKSLVLSNLHGYDSHGVAQIPGYIQCLNNKSISSNPKLEIINDSNNAIVADGNKGLGQVVMPQFLDILFKKTSEFGVVTGALRNSGHIGRLGEWVEYIADNNLVGFIAVNDNGAWQVVSPPDCGKAITSTNPIAFSVPIEKDKHFILDISTSACASGKIYLYYKDRTNCPDGLLKDSSGNTTNNPAVLFEEPKGSLMPMGGEQGHKGFGISMFVDMLVAGLSGGFTPPPEKGTPLVNNVVVTIWNPEKFLGLKHMQEQAEKYIVHLKTLPTNQAGKTVRIPGENSKSVLKERQANGIKLDEGTINQLKECASKLAVTIPDELT